MYGHYTWYLALCNELCLKNSVAKESDMHLAWVRANTAVGVSPETFLLHQVVGGSIPAVAMVWRPALAVWFDSTLCPGGCQRVLWMSERDGNVLTKTVYIYIAIYKVVITISHPDQWGFGSG
jgi:hypothetical protein